jgi:anti-sigma regulatory factor (Ser/Thr protein kinase)
VGLSARQPTSEFHHDDVVELAPLLRRVIAVRVRDRHVVEDLVQETLARVMAARQRLEPRILAPYAVVTARNLTKSLAASRDSTPGAVAAHLSRARARLRVEYLLEMEQAEPPTSRCRPVLLALSAGERRRQRDLDAGGHLLSCVWCARLSEPLLDRRRTASVAGEVRIPIRSDADVVTARKQGRELAARAGFSATDLTIIATAISEIARNIVMFAERGEILVSLVGENSREGVTVVARDSGPGISDLERALQDGYSGYGGMGLGLPGSRRLMDEFEISSEVDKGTTVTMTKWRQDA